MKSRRYGSPNMSDTALLVSVEDLINMAMGPPNVNVVNFKLIQTVLHILARQLRMLETQVEIRITEAPPPKEKKEKKKQPEPPSTDTSSSKSPRKVSPPQKPPLKEIIEEKTKLFKDRDKERAAKAAAKEKEKEAKMTAKEKEKAEKEREKAARADEKDREKTGRAALKDKDKSDRAQSKERDRAGRAESKEREKAERAQSKEHDKAERAESKERDKADRAALKEKAKSERAESREREKGDKHKEKAERAESKDREKAEKSAIKDKEKTERAESREREKGARAESKERDKAERAESKEKERGERSALKDQEKMEKMEAKDRERAEREQEKLAKMDAKDRERAEKDKDKAERVAAKEKEKLEKMTAKDKETYENVLAQEHAKKERAKSAKAGILIKEKDKVLIVEKGPTTRTDSRTRVGSIEVVTVSQFALLESVVRDLKEKAGPLPFPALPDNQKLRSELAKGSASLTDTMQAMQVTARVQAAETAIGRMAGLLTQLAAAGVLPKDVAGKLEDVKAEMDAITEESGKTRQLTGVPRKSVAIDPISKKGSTTSKVDAKQSLVGLRPTAISGGSGVSKVSIGMPGVTHIELDDAIRSLKDDLMNNVNNLTTKATVAAESASAMANAVVEKLDIALKLNTRIDSLYSLVNDYAEQLSGFDAGLTTQMQSFQEQMAQMRNDLKGGVALLETANNNAETAAVMELTERYDGLVVDLDNTQHAHQALTAFQKQLAGEVRSLLECVEMLREQKADRDEVLDGLRDKADNSRLAGLLTEAEFASSRAELERRLDLCYDKFRKQEQVWMGAIKDLTEISESKAEIMQLLAARDDTQQQLRDIQDRLQKLAIILGEPKAAMLTRQLSKGARCGACQVPALQEPIDISFGKPPPLPAARPTPAGEERPCAPEWRPEQPPDYREHRCHRWVGGSHTLLVDSVVREEAGPQPMLGPPTKRYTGYGTDGRLYMMEEELQPCVECNMISTETEKVPEEDSKEPGGTAPADGAGDSGINKTIMMLPV